MSQMLQVTLVMQAGLARTYMQSFARDILAIQCAWGGGGETTRMHTRARRERARERERVRERYTHRQPHALSLSLSLLLSLPPSLSNSLSLYLSFARSHSLTASHLLFLSLCLSRFHAFSFSLAFSPPSLGHTNTQHTHTSHHYILSIDSDVCCTQLCQF